MKIFIIIILIIGIFGPLLAWWIRNVSRIIFGKEIEWLTDNLKKIFLFGAVIAAIAMVFLILIVKNII